MEEITQSPAHSTWVWAGPGHYHAQVHDQNVCSPTVSDYDGNRSSRKQMAEEEAKLGETVHISAEDSQPALDRDLWTRNLCAVGLILGWGASIASITTGIYIIASGPVDVPSYLLDKIVMVGPMGFTWMHIPDPTFENMYMNDHRVYNVTEGAMVVIPLLVQVAVTVVIACLNSIHATTLRWALWREGRLRHNSNLRLFTSSKRYGPNKWPANVVSGMGIILAYAGTTVMTFPVFIIGVLDYTQEDPVKLGADLGDNRYGIDFNGWGLLGLGLGILLQAALSTWALAGTERVGTWNANPLATARACRWLYETTQDSLATDSSLPLSLKPTTTRADARKARSPRQPPQPYRSPAIPGLSEHVSFHLPFTSPADLVCLEPTYIQPSVLDLHPTVRRLSNCVWGTFAVMAAFTTIIASIATRRGTTNLPWVRAYLGSDSFWQIWQFWGEVEATYNKDPNGERREWIGLLIQCAALTIPVFGLHAVETLGKLARDEAIWRRAATVGVDPEGSLLPEEIRNWPSFVIFVYKFVVPWFFGFAIACNRGVFFATVPLIALTGLFFVLGLFSEYLIRARPKGSQPATYGDVQALAALVDDWDPKRIFWGDKGVYSGNVRMAGTSGSRLADLREGVMYVGLSRELESCQES